MGFIGGFDVELHSVGFFQVHRDDGLEIIGHADGRSRNSHHDQPYHPFVQRRDEEIVFRHKAGQRRNSCERKHGNGETERLQRIGFRHSVQGTEIVIAMGLPDEDQDAERRDGGNGIGERIEQQCIARHRTESNHCQQHVA